MVKCCFTCNSTLEQFLKVSWSRSSVSNLPLGGKLQLGGYLSILGVKVRKLLLEFDVLFSQCFLTLHVVFLVS